MRIGDLAAETGVSVRSLRYYEEKGLLTSERTASGQRRYDAEAADRVELIQQLYGAGLSTGGILELLPCVVNGEASPELLVRLREHRGSVERQINDLRGTLDRLDSVIARATRAHDSGMPCREG
ncbi:MerR family transcriptional regulator [Lentzea guizhouensis]|uniref:MerR family transcriptional regulator n=1 Tax=Lentzea guizhouensis TaxID=1586287 RepID=A0A1B2HDN3_9PSEU|nr:MerR family transcriptional regulator [Lentzea guizhouensis]ANZ35837.1 MerR family transcriptional regulator [Lentzea guizhouensis]